MMLHAYNVVVYNFMAWSNMHFMHKATYRSYVCIELNRINISSFAELHALTDFMELDTFNACIELYTFNLCIEI